MWDRRQDKIVRLLHSGSLLCTAVSNSLRILNKLNWMNDKFCLVWIHNIFFCIHISAMSHTGSGVTGFIVYYYNNIAPLIFISPSCIQENIHHLVMDHWETFLLIIPLTCGLKLHSDWNFLCRSIQDFMLLYTPYHICHWL